MLINVDQTYVDWIKDNVIPAFSSKKIIVTPSAQTLLAYALQAQIDDALVPNPADLFSRANQFTVNAPQVYADLYGSETMTFNRAMHFLIKLNELLKLFPWNTPV